MPWRVDGWAIAGAAARRLESGTRLMPFGAAGSSATPARPSPRSSRSCVISPPNEWPMMIGGSSSPSMIAA